MKAACLLALLSLVSHVDGHGSMYIPPARNAGVNATPVNDGGCAAMSCMWFSQGCSIGCDCNEDNNMSHFFSPLCSSGMEPTLNDPKYRTFNRFNNYNGSYPAPKDWTKYHPWRAPGSAMPLNPCGLAGGSTKNNDVAGGFGNMTVAGVQGFPGNKLPSVLYNTTWKVDSVVDVAWGIAANHGGGYLYRLCPKEASLTEECFMETPLKFHGDKQKLVWTNGYEVEIDATRVSEGVFPKDSTWTKNPIPACDDISGGYENYGCEKNGIPNPTFPPPKGCNDTCWGYQPGPYPIKTVEIPGIVDKVEIPANLIPGEYVIGFRWDCEHTPQVWGSCGDVTIVA